MAGGTIGEPEHAERTVTLIAILRQTTKLMVDEITTRLEAGGHVDLPPRFHPVFENIDADGTRLTTLATRAGLTHQSVGEVVTELEQRGYVERRPDPLDRRARLVCLTDAGRDVVRTAIEAIQGIERDWTARWRAHGLTDDLRGPLESALGDPR